MPILSIFGDSTGSVRAVADLNREIGKTKAAFDESGKSAKQLERLAGQIVKANEGPQERYNRRVAELATLVDRGKFSYQQAEVYAKRFRTEMEAGSRAQDRLNFGFSTFAGYFSAGAGIALAISAVRSFRSDMEAIVDKVSTGSAGLAVLAQFAITGEGQQLVGVDKSKLPPGRRPEVEAYARMEAEALQAIRQGAVPSLSLDDAGKLVGSLIAAELTERDRKFLYGLQSRQVVEDVTRLAPAIAAFQTSFPELSAEDIISKGLAAARVGSSRIDELIAASGPSLPGTKQLQWSPDFTLTAGALLDRALSQVEEGQTRLTQFQRQFERFGLRNYPQLQGAQPIEVLKFIRARGTDQPTLESFVGNRKEATEGVRILINKMDDVEQLLEDVSLAVDQQLAGNFAELPSTTPLGASGLAQRVASGKEFYSKLVNATPESIVESMYKETYAELRRRARDEGAPGGLAGAEVAIGLMKAQRFTGAWLPGQGWEESVIRQRRVPTSGIERFTEPGIPGFYSPETVNAMRIYLDSLEGRGTDYRVQPLGISGPGLNDDQLGRIGETLQSIDRKTPEPSTRPVPSGRQE